MNTLPKLPGSVLKGIAKATGVNERHRDRMELSVRGAAALATDMWRAKQKSFFKAPIEPLIEVMEAARCLLRKIDALNAGQKRMLELCLADEQEDDEERTGQTQGYKAVPEYKLLLDDLVQAAKKSIELHREKPSADTVRRVWGEIENHAPEEFVAFLHIGSNQQHQHVSVKREELGTYPKRPAAMRAITEAVEEFRERARKRGGRPRGSRYEALAFLVQRLRIAIEEAGGRLTYEKKTEGGTLVTVLENLRPYLDGGLIPDPLPWSSIEKITSRKTIQNKT